MRENNELRFLRHFNDRYLGDVLSTHTSRSWNIILEV